MDFDRLKRQIEFIVEIDKAKHVFRQTLLIDGSRNENDAEHSWHLAVMAMILSEHAEFKDLKLEKVMKMVLIHDLVEIDAGDVFCYDEVAGQGKLEREQIAAKRIFGILPADQAEEFQQLWQEFEAQSTPEAVFAAALDRLQPLIHNYHTNGHTWQKYNISSAKVYERNACIKNGVPELWVLAEELIEDSIRKGILKR